MNARNFLKSALLSAILAALVLGATPEAQAFPGMIRHGYVHCTACHVSPSGGGVLTEYGRQLSQEILSAASNGNDGGFLANWIPSLPKYIPEGLMLGGDVRAIGIYKDNPVFRESRLFMMQADLEAAYRIGNFTVDAMIGSYDGESKSLRHYVIYHADDTRALRFGRFMTNFGINTSEHTIPTRRNLGFDQGSETYNLEASWLGEQFALFGTVLFGRPETMTYDEGVSFGRAGFAESGVALRASRMLADRFELGVSLLRASNDFASRSVAGPFVILGFTPRLVFLSEWDLQWRTPKGSTQSVQGVFASNRLQYEPIQGLNGYLLGELARPSFKDSSSTLSRAGLGVSYYPRPHYEIDLRAYRQLARANPADALEIPQAGTFGWLLAHYYW